MTECGKVVDQVSNHVESDQLVEVRPDDGEYIEVVYLPDVRDPPDFERPHDVIWDDYTIDDAIGIYHPLDAIKEALAIADRIGQPIYDAIHVWHDTND